MVALYELSNVNVFRKLTFYAKCLKPKIQKFSEGATDRRENNKQSVNAFLERKQHVCTKKADTTS